MEVRGNSTCGISSAGVCCCTGPILLFTLSTIFARRIFPGFGLFWTGRQRAHYLIRYSTFLATSCRTHHIHPSPLQPLKSDISLSTEGRRLNPPLAPVSSFKYIYPGSKRWESHFRKAGLSSLLDHLTLERPHFCV